MDKTQFTASLIKRLESSLSSKEWAITSDNEEVAIKHKYKEGIGFQLSLQVLQSRLEQSDEETVLQESVYRIVEMAQASIQEKKLRENVEQIYPVLRSPSHPEQNKQGHRFYTRKHTAESAVFYALDLGKSYVLIDNEMADEAKLSEDEIHNIAISNLKKLDTSYKEDSVAGNQFYFFSNKDGYAASRVLNDELLTFMRRKIEKEMAVAIPHQDVLIIAEIQNEAGFQVLSKLNMDFCVKGDIPISPLPFIYTEKQELEPIMILNNPGAQPRVVRKNRE
jgi:uncharacterized protein YtpQ (UPF0354 family)